MVMTGGAATGAPPPYRPRQTANHTGYMPIQGLFTTYFPVFLKDNHVTMSLTPSVDRPPRLLQNGS